MDDERHVAAREEIRLEAEGAGLGRVAGALADLTAGAASLSVA